MAREREYCTDKGDGVLYRPGRRSTVLAKEKCIVLTRVRE